MTHKTPKYWSGKYERVSVRLHENLRAALDVAARKQRVFQKDIIEDAIVEFIASRDYDAARRYKMRADALESIYRIDSGVMNQLRAIAEASGETIQTMMHEVLVRKLNVNLPEEV